MVSADDAIDCSDQHLQIHRVQRVFELRNVCARQMLHIEQLVSIIARLEAVCF
jgi:hypothetical protein